MIQATVTALTVAVSEPATSAVSIGTIMRRTR